MQVHHSIGDGNCLFRSCAFFLRIDHRRLRQIVTQVMKEYPHLPISGVPLSTWLKEAGHGASYPNSISINGTFGSALEIALISIMFRRTIYVYKRNSEGYEKIAEFFPQFGDSFNLLWSGAHYDSLLERK